MENFRKLGITELVLKAIEEEKFEHPSEIQDKSIPLILEGKDVIAGSATGSGKTLAFAAGIIKNCEKGKGVQALVLTPTRELAEQVASHIKKFSKYKPLKVIAIYGGVSINPQINDLKLADVVVATPGRLLDHLERGTVDLQDVKILVLDEADRMLDMGFIDDVQKIIKRCPEKRQTLLFSATISEDVAHLSRKYMKNAEWVSVEQFVDPTKLHQVFYDIPGPQKLALLAHLLKNEISGLVMIFTNTRRNTDFVAKSLNQLGIDAMAIHGGFSQQQRKRVMEKFTTNKLHALVCTDVAARGLDIKGVSHIYNYDLPDDSKDYIHRIGRTARAGKEGIAINIVSSRDYDNFNSILHHYEGIKITQRPVPENLPRIAFGHEGRRRYESHGGYDSNRGRERSFGGGNSRRRSFGRREGFGHPKKSESGFGREHQGRTFGRDREDRNEGDGERKRFGKPRRFGSTRGFRRGGRPRPASRFSSRGFSRRRF
jgi:ATP-dependent RNA helicase DeaD